MKRAVWAGLVLAAGLSPALAQHHETEPAKEGGHAAAAEHGSQGGHAGLDLWKWANFALLAGALGYLIKKNAGPFFANRSREIRKQMVEAEELRTEAERQTAAIEARLANLHTEIEALKTEARAEAEAEHLRMRDRTATEMAKVREQTRQEIGSLEKQVRLELKRYSAELAIGLAQQRIRAGMTPGAQDAMVRSFVKDLGPASRTQTT